MQLLTFLLLAAEAFVVVPARRLYNTTSGPMRGVINVHLLCHSHDDVGWLKAPHEYFQGSRILGLDPGGSGLSVYYANGAVQYILTSVIDALSANPDRRFVVVEQWFFQRWWNAQDDAVQARVRGLVASAQLVFANGGLVMHDEASPTFSDMLDQTAAGVRWIAATFGAGALPRVTSQLDPFGHSATQASMLASPRSGYIAQFHARMDAQEKDLRHRTQTLDFAWAPSGSLGLSALTLGSLGNTGYSTPDGFCFDVGIECQAESAAVYSPNGLNNPINDDGFRGLPDAVDDNVLAFVAQVQSTAAGMRGAYTMDADKTVHLPWTMGDDFDYGAAAMNFGSLDKLIHYVNLNTSQHGINIFYSTQADYAVARLGMEAALSLKTCDGFPYSSDSHQVWSGYFTSRPALKGYVRDSSALFTGARLLQAWAAPPSDVGFSNPLWLLETGLGVAQHHDAVSGTSKQVVAFDYARRLAAGRAAAQTALGAWANTLLAPPTGGLDWSACDLANATICAPLEASSSLTPLALLLVNAQTAGGGARLRLRLPVSGAASWQVLGADGVTPVSAQLVPPSPADAALRVYYGAPPLSGNASWLCFVLPPPPPAGYTIIFLVPVATAGGAPSTAPSTTVPFTPLSNGVVTLNFDVHTGLLSGFSSASPTSAATVPLAQQLLAYRPATDLGAASGAYVFRPNASEAASPLLPAGASAASGALSGPVLSEAWLETTPWAFQRVTLWSGDEDGFDVTTTLGPLPVDDFFGEGMEVISRFSTGWATQGAWETDSNAREWQRRERNSRPDYNLTLTEPVAMNYYPVNTAIRIASPTAALTVVTDRTQGGASLADGDVELMLHRRLTHDDDKGVFEALDERGVDGKGLRVVVAQRVLVNAVGAPAARAHRAALQAALLPPQWLVAPLPASATPAAWAAALRPGAANSSLLVPGALPPNVQLLTLHAWNSTTALLRLAHVFEVGEDPGAGSANATVSLAGLFSPPALQVKTAVEYTLTGGQPLADVEPVTYRLVGGVNVTLPVVPPPPSGPGLDVTLAPMDVRTFLVDF